MLPPIVYEMNLLREDRKTLFPKAVFVSGNIPRLLWEEDLSVSVSRQIIGDKYDFKGREAQKEFFVYEILHKPFIKRMYLSYN